MLSGGWNNLAVILIAAWFGLMCFTSWKLRKLPPLPDRQSKIRRYLTVAGIGFSTVAVGALLALHLSWISPGVSQRLGVPAIRLLSFLLFWPAFVGLILNIVGSGRIRFLGIGTSLIIGVWWFYLSIGAAISMSAPLARHPNKFLIPQGYVGWVGVRYGDKDAPPLPTDHGMFAYRIPATGFLSTSSPLEAGWASDYYFYYSDDGAIRALKSTGWGLGGMIWGEAVESQETPDAAKPSLREYFYVGTEGQYHQAVANNEPRPFNESRKSPER
jgi:hypothetical protein